MELLRGAAADFPTDAELSELEELAQDGVKRSAEASRLITESQELFAQRRSAEAIQLLREAHALDKNNALARAILANALVEHAHSLVETDWREAETLAKQALDLNPSHPTAKTIRTALFSTGKKQAPVEEWAAQARKLRVLRRSIRSLLSGRRGIGHLSQRSQTASGSGRDPARPEPAAPPGPPPAIWKTCGAWSLKSMRLRMTLRRKHSPIASKGTAANYWTDGEITAVRQRSHAAAGIGLSGRDQLESPHGAVIFHVPPRSAPKPAPADSSQISPIPVVPGNLPPAAVPSRVPSSSVPPSAVPPSKILTTPQEPQLPAPQAAAVPAAAPSAPAAKVTSPSSRPKQPTRSNSTRQIVVSAVAIVLVAVAATAFFARKHTAPPVAKAPSAASTVPAPTPSAPTASAPAVSAPAQTSPEPSSPALDVSSDAAAGKVAVDNQAVDHQPVNGQPPAESGHDLGSLLVVAGQDDAKVFLNGKLQRQVTHGGQLRLPNLELNDYVVQVSKSGFQDPPQQKIRIRKGEQVRLIFNLQPQPRLASLTIQGGAPGTTVLVDQILVGTIQPDGTLFVSTVNPGDHTVELRRDKERFKPRQFKKHFVVGGTISLAAADAALEAVPGELKITFSPADATVALVKGDLLKIVNSGVPLNLAPGTYTLTARTAERFTRSSTLEVVAGQSRTVDLSLAPNGMSKWDDPGAWKREGDSFTRKGGDFVLYGVVPASGTFVFSAMLTKGHLLQWVLNYSDPKNYVLLQMDDNNFYRTVIRNGEKRDEIIVPDKGDKKSFRTFQIRVSPARDRPPGQARQQLECPGSLDAARHQSQPGQVWLLPTRQRPDSALQLRPLR